MSMISSGFVLICDVEMDKWLNVQGFCLEVMLCLKQFRCSKNVTGLFHSKSLTERNKSLIILRHKI